MAAKRFPPYPKSAHSSGQARIKIAGEPVYLGAFGSPASWAEYRRRMAEWESGQAPRPRTAGHLQTVSEVILAYLEFARGYYAKDGQPTDQYDRVLRSLNQVLPLYGPRPVADFDQVALEQVRAEMVRADWSRGFTNSCVGCIRRAWKWAASRKLIPVECYQALTLLEDLKRGRSAARETEPVEPVPVEHAEACLPFLMLPVRAMVQLQLLTGMRPGEARGMTLAQIDRSGEVWIYRPTAHKTAYRGGRRAIFLGPQAQEIIRPFLSVPEAAGVVRPRKPEEHLFRPCDALAWKHQAQRAARKSKVYGNNGRRRVKRPKRQPGQSYRKQAYQVAVARACQMAGVPHWHPHQLRHTAATKVRADYGPDAARALLGHRSLQATQIYAEVDGGKVAEIMRKIG